MSKDTTNWQSVMGLGAKAARPSSRHTKEIVLFTTNGAHGYNSTAVGKLHPKPQFLHLTQFGSNIRFCCQLLRLQQFWLQGPCVYKPQTADPAAANSA